MRSGFFNSEIIGYDAENMPVFDRAEEASFFAKYFSQFISNGVFPNPSTNMQVLATENMNIKVDVGVCYINGYMGWVETPEVFEIEESDTQSRIDRVVARLDFTDRSIKLTIKKGTPLGNPVAPVLQRDYDIYEIALADVRVNANVIVITQENITDLRLNTEVCGIVANQLQHVDTTTLFNQYKDWLNRVTEEGEINLNQKQEEFENNFNNWFERVKGILNEDVAGNLMQIKLDKNSHNYIKKIKLFNENEVIAHKGQSIVISYGDTNSDNDNTDNDEREELKIYGAESCNEDAYYQIGYYWGHQSELYDDLNVPSLLDVGYYSIMLTPETQNIPNNLFNNTDNTVKKRSFLEVKSIEQRNRHQVNSSNPQISVRQDLYNEDFSCHWYRIIYKFGSKFNPITDYGEWIEIKELTKDVIASNAGSHNSIYRGKDITSLFYDGTLSKQISAGTFDDIFIGDYIVGQTSGRKYFVADLNYYLGTGNIPLNINHMLMVPEKIIGTGKMNDTDVGPDAYVGSKMYKQYLKNAKNIIGTDFGGLDNPTQRILGHKILLPNSTGADNYVNGWGWCDSLIELMNESMVFGQKVWATSGYEVGIDNSQLALFRLDKSKIIAKQTIEEGTDGANHWYWLRDLCFTKEFCNVGTDGKASTTVASGEGGIRPYFLLY